MARKPKLRIRVTLVVDVDRDAYEREYHETASADDLRAWISGEAVTALESAIGHVEGTDVNVAGPKR